MSGFGGFRATRRHPQTGPLILHRAPSTWDAHLALFTGVLIANLHIFLARLDPCQVRPQNPLNQKNVHKQDRNPTWLGYRVLSTLGTIGALSIRIGFWEVF